jgi:NADH-quinone oxidoreductase subunit G
VRFTAEIAGTYELGGMNRGEHLEIGTYDGKPLTTELSGNVIDVCPVGALTNKVFRFRARPWELIARESIGYHDALGSNMFVHLRRGDVLRTVPRDNEAINECWLSDRDRYSHQGLTAADRAARPMVKDGDDWRETTWDEALERAASILGQHTGDALGVLVHPSISNEEGALLARLADGLGCGNLDHRIRHSDFSDAPVADTFAMPVAAIEKAAAIVLVGCNPRTEMPLLAQRIRKAARRGARVYAINPVDFDLALPLADKRIVRPSRLAATLQAIADGNDDLADALEHAGGNTVVILGEIAETHPQASRIRAAARALCAATGASLNRLPQGANAIGLARVGVLPGANGQGGRDASQMLADPRAAYVIYGIEPGLDFAAATLARQALGNAQVVAFSHFACKSTRAVADVILPIGLLPEVEGTLVNVDGIAQSTAGGGKLPLDARPGWRVLRALGGAMGLPGFEFTDLTGLRAGIVERTPVSSAGIAAAPVADGQGLERIASSPIYRIDGVLRRSPALQAHPLTRAPCAVLHPDDALAAGLANGAMATVSDRHGSATLPVEISARVAKGAVWVESCHGATAPLATDGTLEVTGA